MKRKLITFLGTYNYEPSVYYFDEIKPTDDKYGEMKKRFVQLPICERLGNDIHVVVFLTESARKKNWENSCQYKGLKEELESRNIEYSDIDIKDGSNELELWENFTTIYNQFEDDDEIYMDITYSFRSIPTIVMSVINYAEVNKNIKFKNIYYGAYQISSYAMDIGTNTKLVPIFELSFFNIIQKWSRGAELFLKTGNCSELSGVINEAKRAAVDSDLNNSKFQLYNLMNDINHYLKRYSNDLWYCRGKNISGDSMKLKASLSELGRISINQFLPISDVARKLEESLEGYNGEIINDSICAVEECIKYGLIQQAYTMLREAFITYTAIYLDFNYKDREDRKKAESAICNTPTKELSCLYFELSKYRNDIAHDGFQSSSKSSTELSRSIKSYIDRFKRIIAMDGGYNHCSKESMTPKNVVVILSHKLLEIQEIELKDRFHIDNIIYLPYELQNRIQNIPPELSDLGRSSLENDIEDFVNKKTVEGDFVIAEGEWGLTFSIVSWCLNNDRIPIYALSKRCVREVREGKVIKTERKFEHAGFRQYTY